MGKKFDAASHVTHWAITQMREQGQDWTKPWAGNGTENMPTSMSTGKQYRGINTLVLWSQPYSDHRWGTYKAWRDVGAQVPKGCSSDVAVVFWTFLDSKTHPGKKIPFLRYSKVWNAEQVENAPALPIVETVERDPVATIGLVDAFIGHTQATIKHSAQAQAYYAPGIGRDYIHIPNRDLFTGSETSTPTESYYSTVLHELTHWTGSEDRLNRVKGKRWGDQSYAFEELVAELGAAMLCQYLGIQNTPRDDYAKYLNNWMQKLEEDHKAIISAASLAGKALDYLDGLQPVASEVAA